MASRDGPGKTWVSWRIILPRQGEVAGACQTEGEVSDNLSFVSSPSVTFGDTSPWRGRIGVARKTLSSSAGVHRVRVMSFSLRPALILLPLALASCGRSSTDQQALNSLDAELTNGTRDPAVAESLGGQIMVDPRLTQSSNTDAVRPPPRPDGDAVPPEGPLAADPVDPRTLKRAPAASNDCPECKSANGALTLGALAERQKTPDAGVCAQKIGYSAGWANRLPADLPLYPATRLTEAAGADRDGCRLRVLSFSSSAGVPKMLDWYFTKATAAGYSAGHSTDGTQHVLGGVRGNDAYVVYVTARAGGGSDVDLVSNAGR